MESVINLSKCFKVAESLAQEATEENRQALERFITQELLFYQEVIGRLIGVRLADQDQDQSPLDIFDCLVIKHPRDDRSQVVAASQQDQPPSSPLQAGPSHPAPPVTSSASKKAGGLKRTIEKIQRDIALDNAVETDDDSDEEDPSGGSNRGNNGDSSNGDDDDPVPVVASSSQTHHLLSMQIAMLERLPDTLSCAACPSAASKTIPVQLPSTSIPETNIDNRARLQAARDSVNDARARLQEGYRRYFNLQEEERIQYARDRHGQQNRRARGYEKFINETFEGAVEPGTPRFTLRMIRTDDVQLFASMTDWSKPGSRGGSGTTTLRYLPEIRNMLARVEANAPEGERGVGEYDGAIGLDLDGYTTESSLLAWMYWKRDLWLFYSQCSVRRKAWDTRISMDSALNKATDTLLNMIKGPPPQQFPSDHYANTADDKRIRRKRRRRKEPQGYSFERKAKKGRRFVPVRIDEYGTSKFCLRCAMFGRVTELRFTPAATSSSPCPQYGPTQRSWEDKVIRIKVCPQCQQEGRGVFHRDGASGHCQSTIAMAMLEHGQRPGQFIRPSHQIPNN
ncbi:hypothetical protein BDB00DRAFT_932472 [Zychaea mexicana]|uniref:uncharacterized protein n=1 Tax=Zychaea mexicana TaxID=64656 RepID=UPI0022FE735E|nr:uncharacterized protein BDB00DRAFT_932472 [Zychaea mexicana]KAI9488735.1 hypothetical protein BDB00DRAFT_932472 [Zychaea mexicana]